MFPEIFKALSARGIQKLFPIRGKARNLAKVEGSIVAGSLTAETSNFTSYYFAPTVRTRKRVPRRYDDGGVPTSYPIDGVPDIFCEIARFGGKMKEVWWSCEEDKHSAHTYILLNCEDAVTRYFESQQVRLDSLEDLLDVMAVGNPVMQRMLSERRAALGMPPRDPQESDPTRQQPSNPTNYFQDILRIVYDESFPCALRGIYFVVNVTSRLRRNLRYDGRLTTNRLSTLIRRNTPINTTTKEVEGAEAKAKAAQAYTEEASKTLRGRNICKMVTEEEEECVSGEEEECVAGLEREKPRSS
uniref:Uncharacterized protein n=1 Tax=Brassica oleracea var. oleracea TaxID=109376 RepID=A0A0D3A782_BRAOL